MSKKIAIGIINTHDQETFTQCKNSLPDVDYVFDVHNTTKPLSNILSKNIYNRYMSYGGLSNIILRECLAVDADYIFLIKSNIIVEDKTIFEDYINTAKIFGTWFMCGGSKSDKYLSIEDEITKKNLNLFENLTHNFIFMLKSHIKHCGFFNEGYTNIDASDNVNCLEIYDYYSKIENKIQYLPKGYFPDTETSLTKLTNTNKPSSRPGLKTNNTNNITSIYGQFYYNNKFIPGQHKTAKQEDTINILEKIQKIYGTHV